MICEDEGRNKDDSTEARNSKDSRKTQKLKESMDQILPQST
jgi:hypothetical protein